METSNPSCAVIPSTFGPAYDLELDGKRLNTQLETIAALMEQARTNGQWLTLQEIEGITGYTSASISAQLRHLRKAQFGSHVVEKRRREGRDGNVGGTYEYMVVS